MKVYNIDYGIAVMWRRFFHVQESDRPSLSLGSVSGNLTASLWHTCRSRRRDDRSDSNPFCLLPDPFFMTNMF